MALCTAFSGSAKALNSLDCFLSLFILSKKCTRVRTIACLWQDETRQDKTRQDKTRQDKARKDKTRQDKTRQDKTGQDKTRHDKTRQDKRRYDKTGIRHHLLIASLTRRNGRQGIRPCSWLWTEDCWYANAADSASNDWLRWRVKVKVSYKGWVDEWMAISWPALGVYAFRPSRLRAEINCIIWI